MRCQQCAKFVPVDSDVEPEVELNDAELDSETGEATVTGNVRIVNQCGECGTEVQATDFDVSVDVPIKHKEDCKKEDGASVEAEAERFDEFVPPKAKRQKHLYGVSLEVTATCNECGATGKASWSDKVQASHMEEC